jgi:hypothetical protein
MEPQRVAVWGFTPTDLRLWPPDLQPVPVTSLAADAPVVVHAGATTEVAQWLAANWAPEARPPDIILYQPAVPAPPPADLPVSATMEAGAWRALRRLLACPQQFRMAELAEVVPLRQLIRPVEALDLPTLELPAWAQEHLRTCVVCPDVLRAALRTRLRLREQLICPSVEHLIAYARSGADARITSHLAECPLCAAQVAALRPVLAPEWARLLAAAPPPGRLVTRLRAALGPVLDVAWGIVARPWTLAVSGAQGSYRSEDDPLLALGQMMDGAEVVLSEPDKQIHLTWDAAQNAPRLGLRGAAGQAITEFRVAVQQGDVVVWAATSADGTLLLPPAALRTALAAAVAAGDAAAAAPLQLVILARD